MEVRVFTEFLAFILISSGNAAKILGFFPFAFKSHQNVFAPILTALADKGHDVTYITPRAPSLKSPRLQVVLMNNYFEKLQERIDFSIVGSLPIPLISNRFSTAAYLSQEDMYADPAVQAMIHSNQTYDALIIDTSFAQEAVSALVHKFGCVAIDIATHGDCSWVNEMAGFPDNPAYQIDFKSPHVGPMDFWDRLHNTYVTLSTILVSYVHLFLQQRVMDRYFNYTGWEERPPLRQLLSNRSLFLVNADHILSYAYPLAPHVKLIGGVNILPNKPLPHDLQKFMDEATAGVIYFSMGSNLKTAELVSSPSGKAFLDVFQKLPQRVLMKWESGMGEPKGLPPNVKTSSWFPQQDILSHKNCILFISHGGYLSTVESIYHGVPLIGIPSFDDQEKNVLFAAKIGYGIRFEQNNITKTSVNWALREILQNPRYKEEAMRRSRMLRDRRHTSLEEAVYWIEYVIKYPNSLTPASAYMSFLEMHLIDVQLTIFAIFAVALFILYKIFSTCIGLLFGKPKLPRKQKKS